MTQRLGGLGAQAAQQTLELVPLGTFTSTFTVNLPIVDKPVHYTFSVRRITAASGTSPTVAIKLQGTHDGTNWFDLDTLHSASGAVGITTRPTSSYSGFGFVPRMRVEYTIAGTSPSLTFSHNLTVATFG